MVDLTAASVASLSRYAGWELLLNRYAQYVQILLQSLQTLD